MAAGVNITAVFGPQHGVRGDLQDNMMESPDFTDPTYGMPVFSLYGEVRRPKPEWMGTFDVVQIGRAHVLTPVTNAHLVCRLLLEKKKKKTDKHIHTKTNIHTHKQYCKQTGNHSNEYVN